MSDIVRKKIGLMRQEGSLSDFIALSSIVAPGTIICRNGELVASYVAKGISFETEDQFAIEDAVRNLNTLYRTIARNDVALQIHRLRRRRAPVPLFGERFGKDRLRHDGACGSRSRLCADGH